MKPIRTPDCNATLTLEGAGAEHDLPCIRSLLFDPALGETEADSRIGYVSRWMPDEAEAQRLEAGGAIEISLWGERHPPISVAVTQAVIPERELIDRGHVDRALGLLYASLNQKVREAVGQIVREGVPHGELAGGLDRAGAEVVGVPAATAFADLWAECVEQTMTDRTDPTEPEQLAAAAIDQVAQPNSTAAYETQRLAAEAEHALADRDDPGGRRHPLPVTECSCCEAAPNEPCRPGCEANR